MSSVCQQIKEEYQAWAQRRLDAITLDYLFLDASFFRMHPGSPAEPVLAAWGITTDGKPAFIGLAPGTGESADAWHAFLADLKDRGLASPLLVISDGAPGLIAAIEQAYPKALRQRCLIHRARNILAKIPAGMQAEVKDAYWKIFGTGELKTPPGPQLVEIVDARISEMADRYSATYPSAMKALTTDKEGLSAYLRFPAEHHNRIRHSNFIERTFGETRRRTKVIGRLPGKTSCLTLVWAVLDRASRGWRGLNDDLRRPAAPAGPAPFPARPALPAPATYRHRQPSPPTAAKPSVPSPNLIMKPGTTPADLHRIPAPGLIQDDGQRTWRLASLLILERRRTTQQDKPASKPHEDQIEQTQRHGRSLGPTATPHLSRQVTAIGRLLPPHRRIAAAHRPGRLLAPTGRPS